MFYWLETGMLNKEGGRFPVLAFIQFRQCKILKLRNYFAP